MTKSKRIGAQSSLESLYGGGVFNSTNNYFICKECGTPIAPYVYARQTHKRFCGKPKSKTRQTLQCKKVYHDDAKYIIFYDDGQLHYFSFRMLQDYVGINQTTLKKRYESNKWTIEQLLGKESPPLTKNNKRNKGTRKEQKEKSHLNKKQTNIQNLLMKL